MACDYDRYYEKTGIPDESATVTIVCDDPSLKVGSGNLERTRWTDGDHGHPDVLVLDDLGDFRRLRQVLWQKVRYRRGQRRARRT